MPVFTRNPGNPILRAEELPFDANAVFNPGATLLRDGRVGLLLRVEDRRGLSSIHLAISDDGVTGWSVEKEPFLAPHPETAACEWGFEDARVSYVPELDRFVVTCTAFGSPGPCVYLAVTDDFQSVEFADVVIPPEDKNAALFPRRIDGYWLLLHRPVVMASHSADVWISRSENLESWRHPEQVLVRRPVGWWDAARVGIGPPPIETPEGWLQIYHGVRQTMSGAIYRVGAALLDLERPWIVQSRLPGWLISPTAPYERVGDVGNVVFPCGAILHDRRIDLYYGAADTTVCMASASLDDLLSALLDQRGMP